MILLSIAAVFTAAFPVFSGDPPTPAVEGKTNFFSLVYQRSLPKETIDKVVLLMRRRDSAVSVTEALLDRGLELIAEEKYTEAIPLLEEVLRRNPELPAAWEGLGWGYIKIGETEHALRLWTYFQSLMPNSVQPYNLLAQISFLYKDWKQVDSYYAQSIKLDPKQYEIRFQYAQNLLRMGRTLEAEKVYRALMEEEPDRTDVQVELASLLQARMEYDESVEILRHVNAELPGNVGRMLDQAVLELYVGEIPAAEGLCADVLALDTNNLRAIRLRTDIAFVGGGDLHRVREIIKKNEGVPILQAELYQRLVIRCQEVNEKSPNTFSLREILGFAEKSVKLDPRNPEYQIAYSELLLKARKYTQARSWAVNVLSKFNPNNIHAKKVLFEVAMAEERFDDAEQALIDLFSKYDPISPARLCEEARLLMFRGEYMEAMERLDQLEVVASKGTVLTLLYHGLTESDWMPIISVRRLMEHLYALKQEGFTFISPADIPKYVGLKPGESRPTPEDVESEGAPLLARAIDWTQYLFSGERNFKGNRRIGGNPYEEKPPMKVCAVTFDDGLRSTFALGTKVAQSLGVPFGSFVITREQKEYEPSRAGWDEVVRYAKSSSWVIGSHLYASHEKNFMDEKHSISFNPLPNRVWLPEKKRLESMNEWDRRMRKEFRLSRSILRKELGQYAPSVDMVAYPEGDIGQVSSCNLPPLRNPVNSILAEARRNFKIGLIQGLQGGYTSFGDNLLLTRRYEPGWMDEADTVIKHVYETHPVFRARTIRVQIAFLMNRPHLAEEMLSLLRRDGYPEELCRRISLEVREKFRNTPNRRLMPLVTTSSQPAVRGVAAGNERLGTEQRDGVPALQPRTQRNEGVSRIENTDTLAAERDLRAQAREIDSFHEPDEDLFLQRGIPADAFDTNRLARVRESRKVGTNAVEFSDFEIVSEFNEDTSDPWIHPHHPFVGLTFGHGKAADAFETTRWSGRAGLNLNNNSTLSVDYEEMRIKQKVHSRWNRSSLDENDDDTLSDPHYSQRFEATRRDLLGRFSHRMDSGAVLTASFGAARYVFDYDEWKLEDMDLEDELGQETFEMPEDDTVFIGGVSAQWQPRDDLNLQLFYLHDAVVSAVKLYTSDSAGGSAQWKPYDDWLMDFRTQYWNYEDDNAMFFVEADSFLQTFPELGVWSGIDLSSVTTSEPSDYYWTPYWDQRAMGVLRYLQFWQGYSFKLDFLGGFQRSLRRPLRRRMDENWSEGQDWKFAGGASATYTKSITSWLDFFVDGDVMAMNDYIDHRFLIGFNLIF